MTAQRDVLGPVGCHNGRVDTTGIAQRTGLAARTSGRALFRMTGAVPQMSRRAWVFDILLMAALTALNIVLALRWMQEADIIRTVVPVRIGPFAQPVLPSGVTPPMPPIKALIPDPISSRVVVGVVALSTVPMVLRRRVPLTVFWIVVLACMVHKVQDGLDPQIPVADCLIAAYSAVMYSPYRIAAVWSLPIAAALVGGLSTAPNIPSAAVPFLILCGIGLAVNTIHIWRQRVESGRERIRALEAQQRTATRLAVERERARIARELHDVVTHNVSVMVIQAGAARKIMDADPEQARQALLAVESGGRAAMSELRHVMGLLTKTTSEPGPAPLATAPIDAAERRARDEAGARAGAKCMSGGMDGGADYAADGAMVELGLDLAPQPGLGQVAALTGRIRAAGVPVELTVTGDPAPLPAGVDLAAYRVVQEGLTNAVKHAAGASVRVTVDYAPETVRVEVADTGGRPGAPAGPGNGRGLIGLRERLAMYGGTLQAGRRPAGGYRVRAVIPLEQS